MIFGYSRKFDQIISNQAVILSELRILQKQGKCIMSALTDLQAEVAAVKATEASAVVLINGIADRITAAGTDPAALSALTADLTSSSSALAAAVNANTPQAASIQGPATA